MLANLEKIKSIPKGMDRYLKLYLEAEDLSGQVNSYLLFPVNTYSEEEIKQAVANVSQWDEFDYTVKRWEFFKPPYWSDIDLSINKDQCLTINLLLIEQEIGANERSIVFRYQDLQQIANSNELKVICEDVYDQEVFPLSFTVAKKIKLDEYVW